MLKKLPIGIQTFEDIIKENYLYIDKTKYLYDLINAGKTYFLSRPRRFGKSLTVSTLEAIFSGKKELFSGLYIYDTDYKWEDYPVIRLDMTYVAKFVGEELEESTKIVLNDVGLKYDIKLDTSIDIDLCFKQLIESLSLKYNKQVVVLIDEYDKPILDHITNKENAQSNREFLKNFYGVLKSQSDNIKFVFLTGITRFSRVSIFSGLNNLNDISLDAKYSRMFGYTQEELEGYFKDYIDAFSKEIKMERKELLDEIKYWYNGFRFSEEELTVYNPFSTLLLLQKKTFRNYWFDTGTPTYLIELIKTTNYPAFNIENETYLEKDFSSYDVDNISILPLLLQSGYLTIRGFIPERRRYKLGYPNREIESSFTNQLVEAFQKKDEMPIDREISRVEEALCEGNINKFMSLFKSFVAGLSYDSRTIEEEKYYQSIFLVAFRCMAVRTTAEETTNIGRIDLSAELPSKVYILEFKLNGTKEDAMNQIIDKKYYEKYLIKKKEIYLLGIEIDKEERNVGDYVYKRVEMLPDGNVSFK